MKKDKNAGLDGNGVKFLKNYLLCVSIMEAIPKTGEYLLWNPFTKKRRQMNAIEKYFA